jgi:hypothetical protein
MNRRAQYFVSIMLVALALFLPRILQAQDELTLEGLSERVESIANRVFAIEHALTPDTYVNEDGHCRLATQSRLHPTSLLSYLNKFPESPSPSTILIADVHIVSGTGIAITFETLGGSPGNSRKITEYWNGCQFQNGSEWQTVSRW